METRDLHARTLALMLLVISTGPSELLKLDRITIIALYLFRRID